MAVDNTVLEKIREQLGDDDSILVDGTSLLTEGSAKFFKELMDVIGKFKSKTFIFCIEGVNKVNEALAGQDEKEKTLASDAISLWLDRAVKYSQKRDTNLFFVGEPSGVFSDKTVLNQVSFLCYNHNVLLITQNADLTVDARNLRIEMKLEDKRLHCCKVMPDGRLGLYHFSNDNK